MASAQLEHLACANVPYELAQRAAEDWIVLGTGELGDGFLDSGKRIHLEINHKRLVYICDRIRGPREIPSKVPDVLQVVKGINLAEAVSELAEISQTRVKVVRRPREIPGYASYPAQLARITAGH